MHKSSAWPLALVYAGIIVYASLYPFADWRYQGIVPWAFLSSPLPKYWTGFDVTTNALGYAPLGFLLALGAVRSGGGRFALLAVTLLAALLSLTLESLQSYLPVRVPSNVDWVLNGLGAGLGALLAWVLERWGVMARWSVFRARWFVADARGGLVLLALWPLALLFPAAVPFGVGQVLERLETSLADGLEGTPFLTWLPVRLVEFQPLELGVELVCVTLGLVIPCLLGFCITQAPARRATLVAVVVALGVSTTALSAALSYGPVHAWAWFSFPSQVALGIALVLMTAALWASPRVSAALALLALGVYLSMINQAPTSPYFAQTLSGWEQGRFIRFHGLAQWLGWLWPYAALVYVLTRVGRLESQN